MPLTACSSMVPAAPYRFWTPLAEPEQVPPYDHAASPSTLRVIGATPPRSGTSSLKVALEILGFGPCHHMAVCTRDWRRSRDFIRVHDAIRDSNGRDVDGFADLYRGYGSAVDEPTASSVEWIVKARGMEKVKVILMTRDEDKWRKSFNETIGWMMINMPLWTLLTFWFPNLYYQVKLILSITRTRSPGPALNYWMTPSSISAYKNHILSLAIPKENLLVYSISEGWEPLCTFLDVPVPDVPFPRLNDKDDFINGRTYAMRCGALLWASVIASGSVLSFYCWNGSLQAKTAVAITVVEALGLSGYLGWWRVWFRG
ncbi:hypothetical protein BT69DRAFT_1319505 [Atractiella rhizophila]|nr:hypothetical protein BT69DRAFT_1319505 [Atractiella rhizophila]